MADGLGCPNGMVVDEPAAVLFLAETYGGRVLAYDIDAGGALTGRRVIRAFDTLVDGLASDGDDLWVAAGPRFARIDRQGTTRDEIGVPEGTTAITCALGGPSGRTLFMAVAVVDMEEFVAGRASSEIRAVELPPRSSTTVLTGARPPCSTKRRCVDGPGAPDFDLEREGLLERHAVPAVVEVDGGVDRPLVATDDGGAQVTRARAELVVCDHVVHETDSQRFVRVDERAGRGDLLRVGDADGVWQHRRHAPPRERTQLGVGVGEAGAIGRDGDVTAQHELQAAGDARTVHGRDHRLADGAQRGAGVGRVE